MVGRKLMKTLARSLLVIFFSGLFPVAGWPQGGLDSALIEGAKKERRLVHWTTMTLSQSKQVDAGLQGQVYQKCTTDRSCHNRCGSLFGWVY
jgi:hypothetical protein